MKLTWIIVIFFVACLGAFFIMPIPASKSSHYNISQSINQEVIKEELRDLKVEIHYKDKKAADAVWTNKSLKYSLEISYGNKEEDFKILFFDGEKVIYQGPALANDPEEDRGMFKDRIYESE